MPLKSAAQEQLDTLGNLLSRLNKRAKEESDPGGYVGDTSHATKNTENGTVDVSEGARSSENEGDIKHDQPVGIDQEPEGFPGSQDAAQLNIGTQQSGPDDGSAGNVPAVESTLPDPGGFEGDSSHPTADKPNTEKYGAARRLRSQLEQVKEAGTDLLAKIVMSNGTTQPVKRAGDSVLPPETVTAESANDASGAGSVTGGGGEDTEEEKEAAAGAKAAEQAILVQQQRDNAVVSGIADTIKNAVDAADITADYLDGFFAQLEKGAEGDEEESKDDDSEDSEESSESSGPPSSDSSESEGGGPPSSGGAELGGGGGGAPTAGGPDESSIMQLLGGAGGGASQEIGGGDAAQGMLGDGGGAGGGDPMGGAGGMPPGGGDPMAAMGGGMPPGGGGDPMAAMGGMGGGMGGDPMAGGGGGGGHEQQLQMLLQILAQEGISPEELQMAASQKQAQRIAKQAQIKKAQAKKWKPSNQKEAEQFERMRQVVKELVS